MTLGAKPPNGAVVEWKSGVGPLGKGGWAPGRLSIFDYKTMAKEDGNRFRIVFRNPRHCCVLRVRRGKACGNDFCVRQ